MIFTGPGVRIPLSPQKSGLQVTVSHFLILVSQRIYDRLVKEFAWDIPFVNGNKEALMKIRKFFADAHEKAAKELIQAERDVWE